MSGKYEREYNFWHKIYQMHLYDTSGEAAFKGAGLIITWCGTFLIYMINGDIIEQDVILYFAMSIVLEYAVQFVSERNKAKPKQILPGVLTISNLIIYVSALLQMKEPFKKVIVVEFVYFAQLFVSFITMVIIFFDVLTTICVSDKPYKTAKKKPESSLKHMKSGGFYE